MRNDLHVTEIRLKKLSYLEKRLLIHTLFLFRLALKLNVRHDCPLRKKYVFRSIYLHVSAVFNTKQKNLGWSKTPKRKRTFEFVESIRRKDQLNIHRLSSSSS